MPHAQNNLTIDAPSDTVDARKIAAAAHLIEKQSRLIGELHTAHLESAKYAAALVQAVKLAQDGAVDVSDVLDTARQLIKTGSVRLASVDDLFDLSPGELQGSAKTSAVSNGGEKLDPLTTTLRQLA